jgi:UDPglucose 6-dehydrogenase
MRIAMIGTGYVGLVSGACFAELGHDVTCVDIDPAKIETLESGEIPIYEPNLQEMVARNVAAKRLSFTTEVSEGVPGADAVFIAVGTPPRPDDGHADLRFVHAAAEAVAAAMTGFTVVVDKSTVPVGTAREVSEIIGRTREAEEYAVVSNPEFLREGAAIADFLEPDRIVVGVPDVHAAEVMRAIYKPLTDRGVPLLVTDPASAELIKYAANGFLAVKIGFINEIADICERTGANVGEVAKGIGMGHPDRTQVPHAWAWLWWKLFSEGHARIGRDRAQERRAKPYRRGGRCLEQRAQEGHGGARRGPAWGRNHGQANRGPWIDLQGGDRRHARKSLHRHCRGPSSRRR